MISVTLGPDEIAIAKVVGSRRCHSSIAAGSAPGHEGFGDTHDEEMDHHAAGAEIAACIALGGWWYAIRDIGTANRAADVRVGRRGTYQVRSSTHLNGFMPIYENDEGVHVFVVGQLPNYEVIGLLDVAKIKRPEYWAEKNPRNGQLLREPCYLVEQSDLEPISELAR